MPSDYQPTKEDPMEQGLESDVRFDEETRRQRLFKAVDASYRHLDTYRKIVYRLNKAYAGPMYGDHHDGSAVRQEKYVNMLKQAVNAYMTLLASNRPKVLLSTHRPEMKAFAKHFQVGINRLLEEIKIERTINQWVRDAFFWLGVIKVHMADTGYLVQEGDLLMDPGIPFASNISLDNFVYDTNAKKFSECRFVGDVYRMPLEELLTSNQYENVPRDLQASTKYGVSGERLEELSIGYETDDDELEPMVDVCDLWLPRDGVIDTYIVDTRAGNTLKLKGQPIASLEWEGKELGPYKLLHFDEVSENVMPTSTAADLEPLDNLINNLYRKNAKKSKRAKENPVYSPGGADSAQRIKSAGDGEWVKVQDPKEVNVVRSGGVDGNIQGFMINSIELFDRMAGNLQAMMGLGAQADTVGQEKLIHGAASRREGQLQTAVLSATTELVTDLAFLLWGDSYTELPARVEIEGLPGLSYDATWRPDDREGEFSDYQFDIDVYSMQYQGPGARIQAINELLGQIYLPLMPMIQQQGGSIDIAKLTELHSEMLNLPRLRDVILFNSPPVDPSAVQDEGPRKAPVSNRTYTRRNVSGGDSSGLDASKWMEAQPQS